MNMIHVPVAFVLIAATYVLLSNMAQISALFFYTRKIFCRTCCGLMERYRIWRDFL